ncbi:MAG: ribosome-associated translation inhibitor RaiA [Syntrophobacteraceae bacterium]|jgi:putative sigma-54 modulation protein|nr:ribosome-associated translation inhibitor RaiA [Syntrophobacteraceae bacterium]
MQINVTFRHIEPSPPLREYAEEKISRIKKYVEEPIEAHVVLKVEKFRHIAEVSIDANGLRINGAEETDDMYSAIDLVADTIEGQVRRNKDKFRKRKSGSGTREFLGVAEVGGAAVPEDDHERRVIRTEQVNAKPMDVDEAAMQLNVSNGEFLVFTNRLTNRINVLYRRKDGHYGLIETE